MPVAPVRTARSESASRPFAPLAAVTTFALAAVVALAACGSSPDDSGASAIGSSDPGAVGSASSSAGATGPGASAAGGATPEASGTAESPAPSEGPGASSATGSAAATDPAAPSVDPGAGPAAACTASETKGDANREFLAGSARSVPWTVYCAVLPDGWFLREGNYRLRDGGQLRIIYTGPSGAQIELREGGYCAADSGCVPSGTQSGTASFGDRSGTFLTLDGGGYAIAVDVNQPISWIAIGANLDEATFKQLVAGLVVVAPQ